MNFVAARRALRKGPSRGYVHLQRNGQRRPRKQRRGVELGNCVDLFVKMVDRQLLGPASTLWRAKGSRARAFAERSTTPPPSRPAPSTRKKESLPVVMTGNDSRLVGID